MQEIRWDLTHLKYIGKGIIIGAITGIVVSSFRFLIEKSIQGWQLLYGLAHQQPWWWLALIAGLVLIGLINVILIQQQPHIMGSGIPEVESQLAGKLHLQWWPILWRKYVGGILAIGTGLFLGREGPSIQVGSTIGQGVGRLFKAEDSELRIMIAAGSASGLAAAFGAPIAGTFFVLEEIYHNFSPLVWMTALAGAIGSDFMASRFFGLIPVLHLTYTEHFPLMLYGHLIVLGLLLGGLGIVYQQVLLHMGVWYRRFCPFSRPWHGFIPLIILIPIAYFWPWTLGGGNGLILMLQNWHGALGLMAGIFLLRFVFSMISYGSGLPGGIFLPILTLGALIGELYGQFMVHLGLLPERLVINLVIFAMAGYFAGIGKAPFTAMFLIIEMVGTLQNLLPLATVALTAYLTVDFLGGAPIYESLAEQMSEQKPSYRLTGHNDRIELPIFEGTCWVNQPVRNIAWPKNTLLMAIHRHDQEVLPHGDTLIQAGDTLIILVDSAQRGEVKTTLEQLSLKQEVPRAIVLNKNESES